MQGRHFSSPGCGHPEHPRAQLQALTPLQSSQEPNRALEQSLPFPQLWGFALCSGTSPADLPADYAQLNHSA